MRKIVILNILAILIMGCGKQKNIFEEEYINTIAIIEDTAVKFQQYIEFPFNQDWFKSRESIEIKIGKPIKYEESEGLSQWKELVKYYICKYNNMDIYGYIATDREVIYKIDVYDNSWGELLHGKIGAKREEWEIEFGESQEAYNPERVVYGDADTGIISVYFNKIGRAYKISRRLSR